jgi:hypothetical protein
MAKFLIPFTDPERAELVIRRFVATPRTAADEVELLAIVEPLTPGRVSIYLTRAEAEALATTAARQWLAQLETILADAGIRCRSEIALGRTADIIATAAARTGIDSVLLPPPKPGWLAQRLTARRAARLARIAEHHVSVAR